MSDFVDHLAGQNAAQRLWRLLSPLRSIIGVMQTGAHPDDETSALLARLALGDGVEVAYACATRGEGGQNAIGPESGAALGLLRSLEMERAATMLGADLIWLGDFVDFGFARSAESTFKVWGRDRLIEAIAAAIRLKCPDIVLPTFLDVPGQHGHHRAVTQATLAAIDLAADPRAPIDGAPWRVAKVYLPAWSGGGDVYDDEVPPPQTTTTVEAGDDDPMFGASHARIGEWSRAYHRSQGMGRDVAPGPRPYPLHRVDANAASESSVFDGLPRDFAELADRIEERTVATRLREIHHALGVVIAAQPDADACVAAARDAAALIADTDPPTRVIAAKLRAKVRQLARVIQAEPDAIDASPDAPTVAPEPRRVALNAPRRMCDIVLEPGARITPPPGWKVAPTMLGIQIEAIDDPGEARLDLPVTVAGREAITLTPIDYPHVRPATLAAPAVITVQALRVALPPIARVGWIEGRDKTWTVLRQIGMAVELIDQDVARFGTIVAGIGALGRRADLVAALHAWVRAGGHLVTLLHRPTEWPAAPSFDLTMGRPSLRYRVCDPAAAVSILVPDHPLLAGPNPITAADWHGWVRERGLYFAAEWDDAYAPLLSMADADETPLTGGLLSARIGAGRHTHCALALHHQAAALVPGALRLLANLVQPA